MTVDEPDKGLVAAMRPVFNPDTHHIDHGL